MPLFAWIEFVVLFLLARGFIWVEAQTSAKRNVEGTTEIEVGRYWL